MCGTHTYICMCVLDWQNECCLQHTYIQRYIYVCHVCVHVQYVQVLVQVCVHVQYMCLLVVCCLCKLMYVCVVCSYACVFVEFNHINNNNIHMYYAGVPYLWYHTGKFLNDLQQYIFIIFQLCCYHIGIAITQHNKTITQSSTNTTTNIIIKTIQQICLEFISELFP